MLSFVHHLTCGVLSQEVRNFSRVLRTCAGEIERVYMLVMLGAISVGSIFLGERSSSRHCTWLNL